jgi:hypothetical protein
VHRRNLQILLIGWFAACMLPAVLGVAGALGDITGDDASGASGAAWLIGWLVQFGIYFFLARMADANARFSWWLVVSVLPWLIDTATSSSAWLIFPGALVAAAFAGWVWTATAGAADLQEHGLPARGEVLQVIEPRFFNEVINGVYIKRKLRLRIERADGTPPYEAVYKGLFMLGEVPSEGSSFRLRVDPAKPTRFAPVKSDHDTSETPAPQSDPWRRPAPEKDASSRLETLKKMHDKGLVTDDEYEAQRDVIIKSV